MTSCGMQMCRVAAATVTAGEESRRCSRKLTVRDFKSLRDVTVELPRLAVLFGPNAEGTSNLLDATQALSWIGNARTLFDALGEPLPVRGYSFEAFSLGTAGLRERCEALSRLSSTTFEPGCAAHHGGRR